MAKINFDEKKAEKIYNNIKEEERIISGDKRVMLRRPDHFGKKYIGKRYVYEHRYIIEKTIGRALDYNELVHHKDGNKRNNHPSNLEVLGRGEHNHHHPQKKKESNWIICFGCKKEFHRRKPHPKYPFCSRECFNKNYNKIPNFGNGSRVRQVE